MFNLFRQFTVVSIVGMTLTLLSLVYAHLELSEEYLHEHLDSHNKNLSVVLRNSLLAEGLEKELSAATRELSPMMIDKIQSILDQELQWVPVVKVKIYGPDTTVLFSTKQEEIGKQALQNEGVQSALSGVALSGHVHPNHFNEFDHIIEIQDLHQQYIPIKARSTGEVIGVFETYLNVYEVVRDINSRQRNSFWIIGAILVAFFIALAYIFMRTHRLLQVESSQRQAHLDELNQIQGDLEHRVRARTAELDHARNFLQSIIDGIGNPLFVIRPDFTIALMNRSARNLIPPDKDPQQYQYCYQVSHRRDSPCTDPDHPCSFAEVMQQGQPARVRHTHYDADNKPMIVELLTTPLYSSDGKFEGVIEVEHDVTQLVQMQAGLVESEARLQAMMDNVPDAILTCDAEYVIQSNNRSACLLFECKEGELVGKKIDELISDDAGSDTLLEDNASYRQSFMRRGDGADIPIDVWIGPLDLEDKVRSHIVVVRDISQQVKSQRELDTSRQQYFHQDKMVAIGQLAAGILHEVGNPIAAIAGATAEFRKSYTDGGASEDVLRNVDLIDEQITRLGNITREIADFASPRPRERELFDLNGLLRSTARLLNYDRRFSSIGIDLQLDKNLPAVVGVADQLTQVFMNLLINAMDACSGMAGDEECIVVKTWPDGDNVHVSVKDFGVGMSAETLEHVTELFYTTKPVGKGSGLGLSLCDTIVRAHGGKMEIASHEGEGTQVHVILPIDYQDSENANGEADSGETG